MTAAWWSTAPTAAASWNDAGSLFTTTATTARCPAAPASHWPAGTPSAATSYGYYSSRLNLASLAGQNVRFRFRIGTDSTRRRLRLVHRRRAHLHLRRPAPRRRRLGVMRYNRTFTAVADAGMLAGYPNTAYGVNSDMWAGYDDFLNPDGQIARSLVRFNVTLPASATVYSAKLRLYYIGYWDVPTRPATVTASRGRPAPGMRRQSPGTRARSPARRSPAWSCPANTRVGLARMGRDAHRAGLGQRRVSELRGDDARRRRSAGLSSAWRAFSTREGDYAPQLVVTYGLPQAVMNDAPAEAEPGCRRRQVAARCDCRRRWQRTGHALHDVSGQDADDKWRMSSSTFAILHSTSAIALASCFAEVDVQLGQIDLLAHQRHGAVQRRIAGQV